MSATKSQSIMQQNNKSIWRTLGKIVKGTAKVIVAVSPVLIAVFSKLNDEGKGGFIGGVAKKLEEKDKPGKTGEHY